MSVGSKTECAAFLHVMQLRNQFLGSGGKGVVNDTLTPDLFIMALKKAVEMVRGAAHRKMRGCSAAIALT